MSVGLPKPDPTPEDLAHRPPPPGGSQPFKLQKRDEFDATVWMMLHARNAALDEAAKELRHIADRCEGIACDDLTQQAKIYRDAANHVLRLRKDLAENPAGSL